MPMIQIEAYKDFVMIGSQCVNRPADFPAGEWLLQWEQVKADYEARRKGRQP